MDKNPQSKTVKQSTSDKGPRSVERILTILETLASNRTGATLSELAKTAGIPKSSIVGLLTGLTEGNCLKRDSSGRYFLGPRFIALAMSTATNQEFVSLLHPSLLELVNKTGETAIIASLLLDEYFITFLDKVESPSSEDRLETYLSTCRRKKFTDKTLTGKSELRAAIEEIKKDGFARTFDERVVGASALAAPIYSGNGQVLAAIMLAGPTERMRNNNKLNERLVLQTAEEASRLLGGSIPGKAAG